MAFCKACGQEIGTANFCPKCGANQSGAAAPAASPRSNSSPTEGVQQNIAALLCYLPAVGWIISLVFLLIEKRSFVKFHAVQSLALHVALLVLGFCLGIFMGVLHVMHIFFLGVLLYPLIWFGSLVLLLFMMYKAYSNEKFKLPIIGDFADGVASK